MTVTAFLILIIGAYSDYKTKKISIWLIVIGCIITAILYFVDIFLLKSTSFQMTDLIISLIPGISLFIISKVVKNSIGLGDILMVLLLGTLTCSKTLLYTVMLSFILSSAFGLVSMTIRKKSIKYTFPYIPFLLGGFTIVTILKGLKILV